MNTSLADETCEPCRGGVAPLGGAELAQLTRELGDNWRVLAERKLERRFEFADFAQALAFANAIGALADAQGHHPDLLVRWGSLTVTLWTHTIDGLARADFVLAAKIERLAHELR